MDVDKEEKTSKSILAYKVFKQITFSGLWLTLGLAFGLTGPCLPDLMNHLDLNYEQVSRAVTGLSIGFLVGSLVGGVSFSLLYRLADLLACFSMLSCTFGLAMLPWARSLWHMTACFFMVGLSGGCNNSGVNTLVLHLWGKASGPPMYLMHFAFGLGGFLAPQVARPFISDVTKEQQNMNTNGSGPSFMMTSPIYDHGNTSMVASPGDSVRLNGALFFPYSIVAGLSFVLSLLMFIYFIRGTPIELINRRKSNVTCKQLCSPKTCATEKPGYGVVILGLLFLMFFQAVGGEHIYGNFIYSYAIEANVAFDKHQATALTSLFWFSHMTGRFVGAILEICIPTTIILICDVILLTATAVGLVLFSYDHAMVLWVLTACHGFLISPLYPAGMVWANAHLDVNAMSTMVLVFGSSIGLSVYVYIGGYALENIGPKSLMYFLVLCGLLLIIIVGLLVILGRRFLAYKKRILRIHETLLENLGEQTHRKSQKSKL